LKPYIPPIVYFKIFLSGVYCVSLVALLEIWDKQKEIDNLKYAYEVKLGVLQ